MSMFRKAIQEAKRKSKKTKILKKRGKFTKKGPAIKANLKKKLAIIVKNKTKKIAKGK